MISNTNKSLLKIVTNFLIKHNRLNLLLIFLYSIFIIFMHDHAVKISIYIMNQLTLPEYNQLIKYIGITSGLLVFIFLVYTTYTYNEHRLLKILVVSITFLLWLIHVTTMLEMNIEIIHGLMYAILAFLLFAFTGRFAATLMLTLPVMLLDEYYQYMILYSGYVQYFELNDIILDILGCCITFVLLITSNIKPHFNRVSTARKYELHLFLFLFAALAIGLFSGLLVVYQKNILQHTIFIFNKLPQPELFWQQHSFTQAIYHVVYLWEAVLIISVFFFSFLLLDKYFQKERSAENS